MAVTRFKLHDLDNTYVDYTFPINPTEYKPVEDEPFLSEEAIDGNKTNILFPFSEVTKEMSWKRITRTFYLELRKRYRSGNRFILEDHNHEIIIGRIKHFDFSEITATVPSAYSGNLTFEGIGKLS